MFFLACSMALRMAMGTSRALPMPKPAWPPWSPMTTSAAKLRFLPPFTTFVTRLMETTWSFRLFALNSTCCRTASVSLRICLDIRLEFQPRFPCRVGKSFYAAVILVTAPIENHFRNSRGNGALGDDASNDFCRGNVAATLGIFPRFLINGTGGNKRRACAVVNDLRVNLIQRTIHGEPRTFGGARNLLAHAAMNTFAMRATRNSANRCACHFGLLPP